MSKDYIETTCHCGRRFAKPYPSLQKRYPTAPSKAELDAVAEMVAIDLKWHQNKECHP